MVEPKRRDVLAVIGSIALWPLGGRAQRSERMGRIGVLFGLPEGDEQGESYVAVFRRRLHELGWIEGRNIHIDYRWGGDDAERIRFHAAELVKLKPDVIVCQSGLVLP